MSQFINQCSVLWDNTVNPAICTGTLSSLDISQLTGSMDYADFSYLFSAIVTVLTIALGVKIIKSVIIKGS